MNKIYKFGRQSCVPCKMVENLLNEKGTKFENFDVEMDLEKTIQFGISGVPTLILVDENENVIYRSVGFNPTDIENLISQL